MKYLSRNIAAQIKLFHIKKEQMILFAKEKHGKYNVNTP